jgi:uracil-DNA glycosylase family 4
MDADRLRQYLGFYQDLGIRDLYRRVPSRAPAEALSGIAGGWQAEGPAPHGEGLSHVEGPAPKGQISGQTEGAPVEKRNESLLQILEEIGDCRRCRLHEGRTHLVFGVGSESSPLVFVGEGPGADEDAQGIPFVGRAGQLLTQMIENTAKKEGIPLLREQVYICNVVKCRPPGNRTPEPDEMEICGQFLYRQLLTIRPKAICALGGTAARALTGHKEGVTKMRGNWYRWRDIPVIVTYHPSYLLRAYNQAAKREAWEDLKKLLHFVYD